MKDDINLLRKNGVSAPVDAFDIPYDVVKLPSRGLVYSPDHPLCNETEIPFKPMTAVHENILASKALIKKGTVIPVLIKACMVDQSIDPGTLVLGDRAAILLAIRISGFGPEYRVSTVCPSCGHTWVHTFDLSLVELKMLDTNPVKSNENLFEFILPSDKKTTIQFSLLTDADEFEMMETAMRRKKVLNKHGVGTSALEVDTRVTDELRKMIKSVNGNSDGEYISNFVNSMRVSDSRAFRKYVSDISPGVEMEQTVACINCGDADDHKIILTTEFFWPSMESY